MGYILFLCLYMKQRHTICVIIHLPRVIVLDSFCYFSLPPTPLIPLQSPSSLHSCLLPTPYMCHHPLISEIIRPLFFCNWLTSLSMIFSNFIHLPANAIIVLFMSEQYFIVCVCVYMCIYIYISHSFFIHSSIEGHLGWFHNLATVN